MTLSAAAANSELLGVAPAVLHRVHLAGGVLRAEHVRGRGGGELPPLPRGAGERGARAQGRQASAADGEEETE